MATDDSPDMAQTETPDEAEHNDEQQSGEPIQELQQKVYKNIVTRYVNWLTIYGENWSKFSSKMKNIRLCR